MQQDKETMKRMTVYLPLRLHRALKIRAAQENRSMSEIIENAIKKDRPERVPPTQGETHEART